MARYKTSGNYYLSYGEIKTGEQYTFEAYEQTSTLFDGTPVVRFADQPVYCKGEESFSVPSDYPVYRVIAPLCSEVHVEPTAKRLTDSEIVAQIRSIFENTQKSTNAKLSAIKKIVAAE